MLPSRGIVRSLPSGGLQRHLASQSISSRALHRGLGNGRQFSTGLTRTATRVGSGRRCVTAPVVLGSVSSARTFSLWGWWGSGNKKPDEAAAATTPETTTATESSPIASEATTTTQAIPEAVTAAPAEAATIATSQPAAEAVSASASVNPTDLDLSAIAGLENPDILNMPEELGFLHNIGLDYGWGPTSCMQWILEHVHVLTGWGWGGTIIATALLLRAVMFYPQIRSLQFSAAMNRFKEDPRSKEALKLIQQSYQSGDRQLLAKGQFLNKAVREQYDAHPSGMFWSFLQIPFSFGLFRIISGMVHIPVPSLENAGFLWFTDLTASDPYFILPAAGSALLFGSVFVNSKYAPAQQKAMMKKMMYVMGSVGFIGTTFLSAGVNLMMVTTGTATLATAIILNNETVRRAVSLPVLPVQKIEYQAPRPTSPGVAGLRERLTHNLDDMKKGFDEQISSYTGKYAGTEEERAEKKRKENLRKIETMRKQLARDEWEKKYKSGR